MKIHTKSIAAVMISVMSIPMPSLARSADRAQDVVAIQCPLSGAPSDVVSPKSSIAGDYRMGMFTTLGGASVIVSTLFLTRESATALGKNKAIQNALAEYKAAVDLGRAKATEFGLVRTQSLKSKPIMEEIIAINEQKTKLVNELREMGIKRVPATPEAIAGMMRSYSERVGESKARTSLRRGIRVGGIGSGTVMALAGVALVIFGEHVFEAFQDFGDGELSQVQETALGGMIECLAMHQAQVETAWAVEDHAALNRLREEGVNLSTGTGL